MIKGNILQGKEGCEVIIDKQTDIITLLLSMKCTDISSKIMNEKRYSSQPDLIWTSPEGIATVDTAVLHDKAVDFYEGFVESGKAFTDIYGTVIEMVHYIDQITVEEV